MNDSGEARTPVASVGGTGIPRRRRPRVRPDAAARREIRRCAAPGRGGEGADPELWRLYDTAAAAAVRPGMHLVRLQIVRVEVSPALPIASITWHPV